MRVVVVLGSDGRHGRRGRIMDALRFYERADSAALAALRQERVCRLACARRDRPGLVMLLDVPDLDAARAAVDRLPVMVEGVLRCTDLIPVGPLAPWSTPDDRPRGGRGDRS